MKIQGKYIVFILILVVLATTCKFFFGPDLAWSGFSPVIAIALFSGITIRQKDKSFLLPLLALIISDTMIEALFRLDLFPYAGFYSGQALNYAILLTATLVGWALRGKTYAGLLACSIAAPTVYFLVSNGLVWMGSQTMYKKDLSGLIDCYIAGLPFYKNSLLATLIFLPAILVVYNYVVMGKVRLKMAG